MDEEQVECEQCGVFYFARGSWDGDGWDDPRVFEPNDDEAMCDRCMNGYNFVITLNVVGDEDFSKLVASPDWADFLESYENVHLKSVEIKHGK